MSIILDHTIVPAHDKEASAKFFLKRFAVHAKFMPSLL